MILSCCKDVYTQERMNNWARSISQLADKMPVFYLFGKSENTPIIPSHPNVFLIRANSNDNYEDICLKIYYGLRFLSQFDFDYIIKLDENVNILDVPLFYNTVNEEMKTADYLSLTGIGGNRGYPYGHVVFSYWHSSKTSDPRFANMPALIMKHIEYAGGPGYILSRRSYKSLVKNDFCQYLSNEDYSVGLALTKHNIRVTKSQLVDQKILHEVDQCIISPSLELQMPPSQLDAILNLRPVNPIHKCVIHVGGGLGNQLFQIATALSYCYMNDMELLIKPSANPRPYYWQSILSPFQTRLTNESFHTYNEPSFSYTEIPAFNKNIELVGYFQSSKYFRKLGRSLKNMLRFPDNIHEYITERYGPLTNDHVIVHARRGDYLLKERYHKNLDDTYYTQALNYMKERIPNARFIFISDDITYWKNKNFNNAIYFNESDIITLWLMMNSSNLIIANSTFSWWGAYLSGGHVVAPKEWFGTEGPPSWSDIYEASWKVL